MRITLINTPSPQGKISNKDTMGGFGQLYSRVASKTVLPVIDLPSTASTLIHYGHDVSIIDAVALGLSETDVMSILSKSLPSIIGIRTSTPTIVNDIRLSNEIKHRFPDVKVILFGPHVSIFPDILESCSADGVIVGEPELAFLDLINKDEKIVSKPVENLDALPFPAWYLTPIHKYQSPYTRGKPFLTSLSSRGCPYGCIYCPYVVAQGRMWRARSVESVLNELFYLDHYFDVQALLFRDPVFTLNQERTMQICDGMKRLNLDFIWRCETRPDCLSEKLIEKMADSGCVGINVGIESGDEDILCRVASRVHTIDYAKKVSTWCKKYKVSVYAFFIIGLPGETRKSYEKTVRLAKELDPEFVQFTIATPYPGTELYEWAKTNGFIEKDWDYVSGYTAVMRTENFTSAELEAMMRDAYISFYSNPKRWLRLIRRMI